MFTVTTNNNEGKGINLFSTHSSCLDTKLTLQQQHERHRHFNPSQLNLQQVPSIRRR
jgi:hypothetical protein